MGTNIDEIVAVSDTKTKLGLDFICDVLHNEEIDMQESLARIVSSLCDVGVEDMMTRTDKLYISHARWFYWYAYRYITSETLGKIADVTARYGRRFTEQGISTSVNKMSEMIDSHTIWTKRWGAIKRIVNARKRQSERAEMNKTITIYIPKALRDDVKIEIKER